MGYEKTCARLLEYGILAPSFFNSQPWKFSMDAPAGLLGIHADLERARPKELDPKGRDLYLALGFCLENMVLASPALGYELKQTLFPGGPAARLALAALPEAEASSLFPALSIRQTHAGRYQEGTVGEIHLNRLKNLPPFSPQENIYLLTEKDGLRRLELFLHDLSHQGAQNKAFIEEGARWISPRREPPEGLSLESLGLPLSSKVRFALLSLTAYGREIREAARQALLRQGHGVEAPAFLLMTTRNPTPPGFLNAGRWHARLALTLSEMELGAQALHLPITMDPGHPFLRDLFRAESGDLPLLLLRFGRPREKAWPRNGRRPLRETILPSPFF